MVDETGSETPEEETEVVEPTAEAPADADAVAEAEDEPAAGDEPEGESTDATEPEDEPADDAVAAAPSRPAAKPARADRDGRPVVRAQAKYVRTSPRKARLVCDHIRGKSVVEARAILAHTPRAVAEDWSKLLESAVANAEHNHELLGEDLRILTVTADAGPTLKRFRPRAMGRASSIRKRTAHLSIALTPKEQ
jgi:ribosomal protein L22